MDRIEHIAGQTFHGRRGTVRNAFRYGVDYVLLDADADVATPRLFSRNRPNLVALHDIDHGGAPGAGRGAAWAREVLAQRGLLPDRLQLLAQPRVLGHVFNPVSFWLAYRAGALVAVIAEVTNTYGDRHSYVCAHAGFSPIDATDTLQAEKIFHVSPFQPVAGTYSFRFDIRDDRIGVWIGYETDGGEGLVATLTGNRRPLTTAALLVACLRRPFGSRRVLGLIHWQALRLWWKGAAFRSRPEPRTETVSQTHTAPLREAS